MTNVKTINTIVAMVKKECIKRSIRFNRNVLDEAINDGLDLSETSTNGFKQLMRKMKEADITYCNESDFTDHDKTEHYQDSDEKDEWYNFAENAHACGMSAFEMFYGCGAAY